MYEIIHILTEGSLNIPQRLSLILAVLISVVVFIFVVNPVHNNLKISLAKFSCKTISDGDELPKKGFLSSFSWLSLLSVVVLQTGFAKPVIFDSKKLKRPKQNMLFIACTGIFVYIAAALVFFFFYVFLRQMKLFDVETATVPVAGAPVYVYAYQSVYSAIYYLSRLCFNSAIIAFLPLIPFDMGDLIKTLLSEKASAFLEKHYMKITAVLIALAFLTVGRPDGLIENLSSSVMYWLYTMIT